ncbi:hypothetical protein KFK09_023338 [Dendrobium nobile]|uniref:Uncharacterized protein n=1 Tax=Dendrobium nobile TaxID=94219 RepID=A0A8T3ALN2_DENNO|nr:hypothetical protein KFK09_023338 [Dendrobium nobile]
MSWSRIEGGAREQSETSPNCRIWAGILARYEDFGRNSGQKCCHGMYVPVIESLDNSYYSDGTSAARACAGEDGDEAVLLHRKGTWIERKGPICECWFVLYPNNVFVNESKAHDITPSTHTRQVSTVRVGLSVGSTVSLTSSMG